MDCPICECNMPEDLACPQCKREWELTDPEEGILTSKPRRVRMVKPLQVGEKLDDCIKPILDTEE